MKICYLANSASVHTKRWVKHFAGRGHHITVVSFDAAAIEGICVYSLVSFRLSSHLNILWNLSKMCQIVQAINPDILHAHYATSYGLAGALTGIHPFVITAWGSDVLVAPEDSWIYRQIVRFSMRRSDLVTSMADHMTRHLVRQGYATAEKIVTLPFGVDTDVFNMSHRTRQHGDGSPIVVSTRRLDRGLDVDVFIKAIPRVLDDYPDAHFIVTSDGPLRPQLERLANDLRIAEQVQFIGEISHQGMPKLLGQADVFVSTSRSDGNNISLNEAMACGAFPLATDIPANRAWIESGRNGLLFPCGDAVHLADAIVHALSQPEWRQAVMSENWKIVSTRANWQVEMARMEKMYDTLLHNSALGTDMRNTIR